MGVREPEEPLGTIPSIVALQSEGGAVGSVHALQTGSLATTFTASQGCC